AMQCSLSGDALWVLCRDPAVLAELPLDGLTVRRRIVLPALPDSFDLSRENQAAVALREQRNIVVASLATGAIDHVIPSGAEPSLLRFQWDGKRVLVGSTEERLLTILDVPTGRTVVRLPLPLAPREFCFKSDGGELFIS